MPTSPAPYCTEGSRWRAAAASAAALGWVCAGATAFAASTPAANSSLVDTCRDPLCYTASHATIERTHAVLDNIDIVDTTRGITHITADRAEANGADPADSHWVLTGHVVVTMPQGKLQADRATVQFAARRISTMSAQGMPALFEHYGPLGAVIAHGHSLSIDYDLEHQHLQLLGDSWLTDGCNEVSSQRIQYDIARQRVEADAAPGNPGRVNGTIHSRSPTPCTSGLGGR